MANGRKSAIGATAVALTSSSNPLAYGVEVKAASANTGKIYVGIANTVTADAADATDGFELSAGDAVFLPRSLVTDTTGVWLIASAAGQKVFWIGV